jgi:hypothetical protein
MKIDPNLEILKTQYPEKTAATEKPAKDEFSGMLKEGIDNEPSKTVEGSKEPQMISSVAQVQFNTFLPVQNNLNVERTEQFLDLLEQYQTKLMDPQARLKDLHPLIKKLENEKDAPALLMDSLPQGDELKDILNNALVAATVETIKFNRGDYV